VNKTPEIDQEYVDRVLSLGFVPEDCPVVDLAKFLLATNQASLDNLELVFKSLDRPDRAGEFVSVAFGLTLHYKVADCPSFVACMKRHQSFLQDCLHKSTAFLEETPARGKRKRPRK